MEKTFVIARCIRCGRFLLYKAGVKTKICPYCNVRFSLDKATIVACSETAQKVKQMLAELKKRHAGANER